MVMQKPKAVAKAGQSAASLKKTKPVKRVKMRKIAPPAAIEAIFSRFEAANPEPKGELKSVNAFTFLVAVLLSAQATDAGVNKATAALFAAADSPKAMLALGEDRVREAIKSIGLFRTKAKNIMTLCRQLIESHGGEVPASREALVMLAGVGRKTANVVLNNCFGEPTMAVDTHIFRVAHRIPLAIGKTPEAVEAGLVKVIPQRFMLHAHHWLILHGRYVCKARKPDCARCPIPDICTSPEKTVP